MAGCNLDDSQKPYANQEDRSSLYDLAIRDQYLREIMSLEFFFIKRKVEDDG